MNKITEKLLQMISDVNGEITGAFNIREDSQCAGRQSTDTIEITTKLDKSGIDITVKPGTKGETVYIPACITHSNVDDLVYNDFFIGEDADVTIVAGCGVHTEGEESSQHNGIHRFFIHKNAKVVYLEKHIGVGEGTGKRIINPQTYVEMDENSYMMMDTVQIKGVDSTKRVSKAILKEGAKLVIKEKIMTHGDQYAETNFEVDLNGADSGADLVSRSVAKDRSHQVFRSRISGNNRCTGHSECDAIIMDDGVVSAIPELTANHVDASLIHEAAIGKIAGEQLTKLMTLGLTESEAESKIIDGFLK
ncbi:SufB/SufD family protein [Candidatus Soleaferrea massiliensis]|uniref:SufB/SufD family protein n=1 Tax=Candidatus Soleaferrea massiliensis TaxID=1470354 RepID=UPI000590827C|nr:SufD family Fe-S cluster assembly protein [Candidatus Soleaferrea massiliensis]